MHITDAATGRAIALAALLAVSAPASAVFVINTGVDATLQHFVIDAGSLVEFTPDPFSGQPPASRPLSGRFDAEISRWWWEYHLDGDPTGALGTFVFESTWIRFMNPVVPATLAGFEFPRFLVPLSGDLFGGDDGPCTGPAGPNDFCSGLSSRPPSHLGGSLSAGRLFAQGDQPIDFIAGFSYRFSATAAPAVTGLPAPATLALSFVGLALAGAVARRRTRPGPAHAG